MGGMASLRSAESPNPEDFGISAAVAVHACRDSCETSAAVNIPIMFTAGTADTICGDGASKSFCETVSTAKAGTKILFDVKGASHFEPTAAGSNSEVPAIALFLSCRLRGEHCDKVYGASGKEICNQIAAGEKLGDCRVDGSDTPTPSPSAVPSPPTALQMRKPIQRHRAPTAQAHLTRGGCAGEERHTYTLLRFQSPTDKIIQFHWFLQVCRSSP